MLELDGRVIDGEPNARARRRAGENTRPGFRLPAARSRLGARRRSARAHREESLRDTTLASNVSFGARDYDPSVGRWTGKDPVRFQSRGANLFLYAGADPVNFVDPLGTDLIDAMKWVWNKSGPFRLLFQYYSLMNAAEEKNKEFKAQCKAAGIEEMNCCPDNFGYPIPCSGGFCGPSEP